MPTYLTSSAYSLSSSRSGRVAEYTQQLNPASGSIAKKHEQMQTNPETCIINCSKIYNHIMKCPGCSKLFLSNNSLFPQKSAFLYIPYQISIILLIIILMLLYKLKTK